MKALLFFALLLSPFMSFAQNCVPNVDSCGFYLCEEKIHQCGPHGYPIGFGFKFCQIFLNSEQNYSQPAHEWLRRVRVCLMNDFERPNDTRNCGQIKSDSFGSHVGCYVQTGFCELNAFDKMQIFWAMRASAVHPEIYSDADGVLKACAEKSKTTPSPAILSGQK